MDFCIGSKSQKSLFRVQGFPPEAGFRVQGTIVYSIRKGNTKGKKCKALGVLTGLFWVDKKGVGGVLIDVSTT